ncbi:MAG: YciI family protein [Devosia sp.]
MPQYLLTFHGGGTPEGEEAQAAVMAAWNEWIEDVGESMIDAGNPVAVTKTIAADKSVTDGAVGEPVTGYSIIDAESFDAAVAMARGCPIFDDGGSVQVGELVDMNATQQEAP